MDIISDFLITFIYRAKIRENYLRNMFYLRGVFYVRGISIWELEKSDKLLGNRHSSNCCYCCGECLASVIPFNATLENYRLVGDSGFQKLFAPLFLKWVLISLIYQPAFLLICFNLFLLGICYLRPKLLLEKVSLKIVVILTVIELLLFKVILLIRYTIGVQGFIISEVKKIDVVFSWPGILSIIFLVSVYFLTEKTKLTISKLSAFLAVLFAGFYIAEYSWHIWPVNQNLHSFFMPFIFASFIPLGAVRLMMKKKTWIVAVLVFLSFYWRDWRFLFVRNYWYAVACSKGCINGNTISSYINVRNSHFLCSRHFSYNKKVYKKIDFSVIKTRLTVGSELICLIFAFLTIKMFLMPVQVTIDSNKLYEMKESDSSIQSKIVRNDSFESWIVSSKDDFLPEYFTYHQDGVGGFVTKIF